MAHNIPNQHLYPNTRDLAGQIETFKKTIDRLDLRELEKNREQDEAVARSYLMGLAAKDMGKNKKKFYEDMEKRSGKFFKIAVPKNIA